MHDKARWEAPTQLFKGLADLKKVITIIKTRGVRVALVEARTTTLYRLAAAEGRRFDKAHGVETNELVPVADLALRSSKDGNPNYVPSLVLMLKMALRQLPRDLSDFVFMDMGSGKGRVLLAASEYRFKEVIGVEFAEELHEQAQHNIAAFRGKQHSEMRSVLCDAREFEIPDEPCVIYIFGAVATYSELFGEIIRNAEWSFKKSPRPIFLITLNVALGPVIESSPVFDELPMGRAPTKLALRRLGAVRIYSTPPALRRGARLAGFPGEGGKPLRHLGNRVPQSIGRSSSA